VCYVGGAEEGAALPTVPGRMMSGARVRIVDGRLARAFGLTAEVPGTGMAQIALAQTSYIAGGLYGFGKREWRQNQGDIPCPCMAACQSIIDKKHAQDGKS
jgi:hypothetical protein